MAISYDNKQQFEQDYKNAKDEFKQEQLQKYKNELIPMQEQLVISLRNMLHNQLADENSPEHAEAVQMLTTQQTQLKAMKQRVEFLENATQPYQEEILGDIEDMEDEVDRAEHSYNAAEAEYDEIANEAAQCIEATDSEDIVWKLREEMSQIYKEQQETNFYLTNQLAHMDIKQMLDDFLQENPDYVKTAFERLSVNEAMLDTPVEAKEYIQAHPFKYANYQMRKVMESVQDCKTSVRLAGRAYKDAIGASAQVAKTKTTTLLSSMVTAAGHTTLSVAQKAKEVYVKAMEDTKVAFTHGKAALKNQLFKARKNMDICLDTISGGAYSRIAEWFQEKSHKDKPEYMENKLYWQQIRDENPVWGAKVANVGTHDILLCNSPYDRAVESAKQAYDWAKDKAAETKQSVSAFQAEINHKLDTAINDTIAKLNHGKDFVYATAVTLTKKAKESFENAKDAGKQTIAKVVAIKNNVQADVLEGVANVCDKGTRYTQSRIKQLHAADHQIFEANNQLRQALHGFTEISPYQKKEFVQSPEVQELTAALNKTIQEDVQLAAYALTQVKCKQEYAIIEKLSESKDEMAIQAVEMAKHEIKRVYDHAIAHEIPADKKRAEDTLTVIECNLNKQKAAFDRAEAKAAMAVDKARNRQFTKAVDAYNGLMDNKEHLAKNQSKLEAANKKLEKQLNFIADLRQKASDSRQDINSRDENDSDDVREDI